MRLTGSERREAACAGSSMLTCALLWSLLGSFSLLLQLPELATLGELWPSLLLAPSMSGLLVLLRSLFLPFVSPCQAHSGEYPG